MKRISLLIAVLLANSIFSCKTQSSSEQKSVDSTSVASPADTLNEAQREFAASERGEADSLEGDTGEDDSYGHSVNRAEFKFLGFSGDLKYAAFSTRWYDIPSGFANIYIVDVDKNDWVSKPIEISMQDGTDEEALVLAMKSAGPQLVKYGIKGGNTGTSYHVDDQSGVDIPFDNKMYKLRLIESTAPDANKYFELQVLTDSEPIVLQKDVSVPRSRGEVVSYKVVAFYMQEDKVAVIVEYNGPQKMDYENTPYSEARQLIVTGTLK